MPLSTVHSSGLELDARPVQHCRVRTPRPWILPDQPATWTNLLAGGASAAMVRTQLDAGRLVRVRRGVYVGADAWPGGPSGQHLFRAYAEQALNPAAVLSHETATVAGGLPYPGFGAWSDSGVALTVPTGAATSRGVGRWSNICYRCRHPRSPGIRMAI